MQPHEGPRRDRGAEERRRQRVLTYRLLLAILALGGVIGFVLFDRWL